MTSIIEAASLLRTRKISAVELARESLRAIHREQPRLNAFITVTEELALEQARRADEELARGFDRGPLHGIPYSLKDNFATRGIRTTCGSKLFENHVPDHDAAVYEKLTAAGAVLMGKAGLHELAYGITCNNPHFGAIRNPHDVGRITGGSSGGSGAAVAAGLVHFSIGTDTGGSIRLPAAFCGCVGLKPTSGRVSRYGVMPLDFSLDHMGPLTRTARDAALVMNAIAGLDARDDTSSRQPVPDYTAGSERSLEGLRVGVPRNFFNERISAPVAAAYADALKKAEVLGARLVEIAVPDPAPVNVIGRLILLAEASALLEKAAGRREDFGADTIALIDQGRFIPAVDYINAQRLRRHYMRQWAGIWDEIDVMFTPSAAIEAPLVGQSSVEIDGVEEEVRVACTRLIRPFNVLGLPAISVPNGGGALPIGLQVIGPAFGESVVLAAAVQITRS